MQPLQFKARLLGVRKFLLRLIDYVWIQEKLSPEPVPLHLPHGDVS